MSSAMALRGASGFQRLGLGDCKSPGVAGARSLPRLGWRRSCAWWRGVVARVLHVILSTGLEDPRPPVSTGVHQGAPRAWQGHGAILVSCSPQCRGLWRTVMPQQPQAEEERGGPCAPLPTAVEVPAVPESGLAVATRG